jgi:hypothetical protein
MPRQYPNPRLHHIDTGIQSRLNWGVIPGHPVLHLFATVFGARLNFPVLKHQTIHSVFATDLEL